MTPSRDGRTFTLRLTLDPAARVEYLIAYRDRFALDPGNPLSVPAPAGPPRSEVRMPEYRPPPLPAPRARGTLEPLAFESRRIRVYVPATDRRNGPADHLRQGYGGREAGPHGRSVLYVHGGDIFLDKLDLPALLEPLIQARPNVPIVRVFLRARDPIRKAAG